MTATLPSDVSRSRLPWWAWCALAGWSLLLGAAALHMAAVNGVTHDEPHHLHFGAQLLDSGRVVRDAPHHDGLTVWAAVPALMAGAEPAGPIDDGQLFRARLASVACLVLLGIVVFAAVLVLTGHPLPAALAPGTLLLSPNLLTHGTLCTTDLPLTLAWTLALLGVLGWSRGRRAGWVLMAVGVAAALLIKASGLFLAVLLPLLAVAAAWLRRDSASCPSLRLSVLATMGALLAAFLCLHVAHFRSAGLNDLDDSVREANEVLDRFALSLARLPEPPEARALPVPLPGTYLLGLQLLRAHELRGHYSYLLGTHTTHGRADYYLLLYLTKTPIAAQLALLVVGLIALLRCVRRVRPLQDRDVVLLGSGLVYVGYASLFSHLDLGFRHALPAVPALTVWAVTEAWSFHERRRIVIWASAACALLAAVETAPLHPYPLSFFNHYLGGPDQAWHHLSYSNLDWGQEDRLIEQYASASAETVFTRPRHPTTGLIALSANDLTTPYQGEGWPDYSWVTAHGELAERVGHTWFVFRVPHRGGNSAP